MHSIIITCSNCHKVTDAIVTPHLADIADIAEGAWRDRLSQRARGGLDYLCEKCHDKKTVQRIKDEEADEERRNNGQFGLGA